MARNKFFNVDLREDTSNKVTNNRNLNNSTNEYNDKIQLPDRKSSDDSIDINNPFAKIFFIVLGLFCILGTAYYIFEWFSNK